jgi:hypothetical protein
MCSLSIISLTIVLYCYSCVRTTVREGLITAAKKYLLLGSFENFELARFFLWLSCQGRNPFSPHPLYCTWASLDFNFDPF